MLWSRWFRQGINNIMVELPRSWVVPGGRRLTGWLLEKNGCLKVVCSSYVFPADFFKFIPGNVWLEAISRVGSWRPGGTARLTGVLNYFTRGPDGAYFATSQQKI